MNDANHQPHRLLVVDRFDAEAAALQRAISRAEQVSPVPPRATGRYAPGWRRSRRVGSWPGAGDGRRTTVRHGPIGRHAPSGLPCQQHDPDLWFARLPAQLERAKALCSGCPVRLACLAEALDRAEPAGVWGGEIFQDGRIIARKRPRGRPRKDAMRPAPYSPSLPQSA